MTNYQKLINKLKEVEEVKNDMEELKFGCIIRTKYNPSIERIIEVDGKYFHTVEDFYEEEQFEIIGNPLEERHLRMYCEKKNIEGIIHFNGDIRILRGYLTSSERKTIATLDNTKPLSEQSEEFYGKILDYLNNI